jgi:TolB-like protein/tetratricopeptide (TPR) repeat protein
MTSTTILEQPRPDRRRILLAVAGLLALLFVGAGWLWAREHPPIAPGVAATKAVEPAAEAPSERSIAVLPFVNMSGDPANDYFSDGLAETTLDTLAQVRDLKVIARTSSFAFKGKAADVREIGRALDAAHLLEGSVQQSGQTVRITAQLVRTSDGSHLWSRQYDRRLADVFAIEDEIAADVAKAVGVALPASRRQSVQAHTTRNVAAYQEYLRGTALLSGRRVAEMREALARFEHAIALDPSYAGAYAQAAITLSLLQRYGVNAASEQRLRQETYATAALRLDPESGEALLAQAMLQAQRQEVSAALASSRRAVELAPSYSLALQWYGTYLLDEVGDVETALPVLKKALAVDPLSPDARDKYVHALDSTGKSDEALAMNAAQLRERPDFATAYFTRASILYSRGDLVGVLKAQREMQEADPEAVNLEIVSCWTMRSFSATAAARACLEQARERGQPARILSLQAALQGDAGDHAAALATAEKIPDIRPRQYIDLLLNAHRYPEALAKLRQVAPRLFATPSGAPDINFADDAVAAATALKGIGDARASNDFARRAISNVATHPYAGPNFGRGWYDALGWALLDDVPHSCAVLRDAAAAGHFHELPTLDANPVMEKVRADPCYEAALAPARAAASAQVAAARKAGLLPPGT